MQKKGTVLLSNSLAWPAVAGCSWAETFSQLSSISFAQPCTELCKNIPAMFREWLAEMLRHSAFLGWAAEHFEVDSLNLTGIYLHNSVQCCTSPRSRYFVVCVLENSPSYLLPKQASQLAKPRITKYCKLGDAQCCTGCTMLYST